MKILLKSLFFSSVSVAMMALQLAAQDSIRLVQLSGVTTMSEDGDVLPFVSIVNQTGDLQTTSSLQGVYSMVVRPGDTIRYHFIGFSPAMYIVPMDPPSRFITRTQMLSIDTFYLPEALVKPLPSKERLEYEFVYKDITDDQLAMARQNTEMSQLMFIANVLIKDGAENAQVDQDMYIDRFRTYNQMPDQTIFSPTAWMDFVSQLFNSK